jgi:hypothetical protein
LEGPAMINPRRWNKPNGPIRKVIDDDDSSNLTASLIIARYLRLMIFAKKLLTQVNSGQYSFFHPIITKLS